MTVTNERYREFLDDGLISLITPQQLLAAMKNVRGRNAAAGRALLICLFWTGARPVEVLDLRTRHFTKEDNNLAIQIRGAKKGLSRKLHFPFNRLGISELWRYSQSFPSETLVFWPYRSRKVRQQTLPSGRVVEYTETTARLWFHFKNWFKGVTDPPINPYFLRHNRLSSLSENGASMQELRMFKGSKTVESITPYVHLSGQARKKLARLTK